MSLSSLYIKLREKENEIIRLKKCEGVLSNHQEDFFSNERLVSEPDLTTSTWYGERSDQFRRIREYEMLESYRDIRIDQFETIFEMLDQKMQQTISELESIKAQISSLEAEELRKAEEAKLARKGS